jgi:transglutaminase-like putative cysteine protease
MTQRGRLDRLRSRVVLAVVVVGALATLSVGGLVAGIGALGGLVAVVGRLLPVAKGSWRVVNIAVLVGCGLVALVSDFKVEAGLALVAWLQVHRGCTGRAPADDRVAILLALLQLLVACIQSISGWLAPLFIAFATLVPMAMVLVHLVESAPEAYDPTAGPPPGLGGLWAIGPVTAALTIVLFFGLPRLEAGGIGGQGDEVGLGDQVELGDVGTLKDNPSLALRATVRDANGNLQTGPFYFRGTVFDHFARNRWTSTLTGKARRAAVGRLDHPEVLVQEIVLEPLKDGVLVGLPGVVRLEFGDGRRVLRDLNGVWRRTGKPSRQAYTVWSVPPSVADRPDPMRQAASRSEQATLRGSAWTSLPPDLDPRIAELALQIVTEAGVEGDPKAEARALERWLRSEFEYTLVPDPDLGDQPLSGFLFDTRRGHCEYFASALAVMLRTRGIPARLVGGFYGGEPNPFADWVLIRQSDAHAWVEAWLSDAGWEQLDATPASAAPATPPLLAALWDVASARWQTVILDYSLETQVEGLLDGFRWLRGIPPTGGTGAVAAVGIGIGGTIVGLLGLVVLFIALGLGFRVRWMSRRRGRVARELLAARALVDRRGWHIPTDLPPVAAADWLVEQAGAVAEPLRALAWMHYRVRYGGESDQDHAAPAREARRALKKALPGRRRG